MKTTSKTPLIIIISFIILIHSQITPKQQLFGRIINSPIGIGPCPLTADAQNIARLAQKGFDVITYKTVRARAHPNHESPNMYTIDYPSVTADQWGKRLHCIPAKAVTLDDNTVQKTESLSLVNSFGIGSQDAHATIADIKESKRALHNGQILMVSVYGSGKNKQDLIADFVAAAIIATTGGADVVELNLSCPNVHNSLKFIYQDVGLVYDVCRAVCQAIAHMPCTIKVGLFDDVLLMEQVLCAAHAAGIRGVCGINTMPVYATNYDNQPLFGQAREVAGLSGAALYNVTKEFVQQARTIIDTHNLDLKLFALGGVTRIEQFDELLAAGADIVQCATGALWNHNLAQEYHDAHIFHNISLEKVALIKEFFKIGAIQIKDITLKSGSASPIYFDMRMIMSHPHLLHKVATFFNTIMHPYFYDVVCGVPYAALPLATAVASAGNYPLIMQRKDVKSYGLQKMVEGDFKSGARCAIIEDVITTGSSILETVRTLEQSGLVVNDIFVIIDREQKGKSNVQKHGYTLASLFTVSQVLSVLLAESLISHQQYARIKQFFAEGAVAS